MTLSLNGELSSVYKTLLTLSEDVGCPECKIIIPKLKEKILNYYHFLGYYSSELVQDKLKDLECQIHIDFDELNEH